MTTQVTKTPSRTVPIAETMTSIGRGFPDKLVIFQIPASSFWWVRYYTQKKILKKSTKTKNKKCLILICDLECVVVLGSTIPHIYINTDPDCLIIVFSRE